MENYYVYILSNKNRTVLYIGFTKDLKKEINSTLKRLWSKVYKNR